MNTLASTTLPTFYHNREPNDFESYFIHVCLYFILFFFIYFYVTRKTRVKLSTINKTLKKCKRYRNKTN